MEGSSGNLEAELQRRWSPKSRRSRFFHGGIYPLRVGCHVVSHGYIVRIEINNGPSLSPPWIEVDQGVFQTLLL